MPTLTIQSEDGKELLKLQIALKKPKKTRSDAGVKRGQKTEATPTIL